MNHCIKKIIISFTLLLVSFSYAYSAKITIDAPENAPANRSPVIVRVSLNAENDTVSGMSGNFSFPTNLFYVESISTESSVVSLWVQQPIISEEKYLDGRTHIQFEGIFPGGYSGVRSPYYGGTRPGTIFTVTLIPKNKGFAALLVDNVILNSYTSDARPLPTESTYTTIMIPDLTGISYENTHIAKEVHNETLSAFITRDPLVSNSAWYLVVNEREQKSAISRIYVAETDDYTAYHVEDHSWKQVATPYILFYQDRSKYVHVKVVYSNGTYALTTITPVENLSHISVTSRILVGIIIVLLLVYTYVKKVLTLSQ